MVVVPCLTKPGNVTLSPPFSFMGLPKGIHPAVAVTVTCHLTSPKRPGSWSYQIELVGSSFSSVFIGHPNGPRGLSATVAISERPTLLGKMTFRVDISTEPDPQGTGRVDIHTHSYTTIACAVGVVTKPTDRDSSRYTYNGIRRLRQLALGCESSWVKSTHNVFENTWKCGEIKPYFAPSAGG